MNCIKIFAAFGVLALAATLTAATYSTSNYREQSGAWVKGGVEVWSATNVELTSPSTTLDVGSYSFVELNSDQNVTGFYPTGGRLGQIIRFRSGSGSNTVRFDDGTSMTIGANYTLTEGQGDFITLQCVSADGDEWTEVSSADN